LVASASGSKSVTSPATVRVILIVPDSRNAVSSIKRARSLRKKSCQFFILSPLLYRCVDHGLPSVCNGWTGLAANAAKSRRSFFDHYPARLADRFENRAHLIRIELPLRASRLWRHGRLETLLDKLLGIHTVQFT